MTTEAATTDPNPPVDPAIAAAAAAAANAPADPPPASDPPTGETPPAAAATDPPTGETPPAAAATDPQAPPESSERPHGNKGQKPWFLQRISEESQARQQAEERARNAEALLERSQARNPADPAAPAAPRADESAIEARARQIAQETLNGEKIHGVIQEGLAAFSDWDDRAATLGAAGAATPDFVLDVISVDAKNAHTILHALADDPQKAARLARMDTRTRTIELVKMSMAASTTNPPAAETPPARQSAPPKKVSSAPPPPPSVEPGASQVVDWRSDKASDQEFSRGWEENQRQRKLRK
jgi:hypothetical protein